MSDVYSLEQKLNTDGKIVLRMVTTSNNNKFYLLIKENESSIRCYYGREDGSKIFNPESIPKSQQKVYPLHRFRSLVSSKLRKGYSDVSDHYLTPSTKKQTQNFLPIDNPIINDTFNTLMSFSKSSIASNYSITASGVSQKIIDDAQLVINYLSSYNRNRSIQIFNDHLINLFTILPRHMSKVDDFLIKDISDDKEYSSIVQREQDLLSNMEAQVGMLVSDDSNDGDKEVKEQSLLDVLELDVGVCNKNDIDVIKKLIYPDDFKIKTALAVKDLDQEDKFNKYLDEVDNKATKLLWHGSRTENWISILKSSLMIKPSNAVISGSMFGESCYFSPVCQKSSGYTSLKGSYWASGSSSSGFLGIFDVHIGNEYIINRWNNSHSNLTYNKLRELGDYHSVYAPSGYDLRNPEQMVYQENQCKIKYLVELTH